MAITIEDIDASSNEEIEEMAYMLQIPYTPPVSSNNRESVIKCIKHLYKHVDTIDEDMIKKSRKENREKKGLLCKNKHIQRLNFSDEQLLFVPSEEEDNTFYCFNRRKELYMYESGINPYTK